MRSASRIALATILLLASAAPAGAQRIDPPPDTAAADTLAADTLGPSPRGAFLRSLILPGWGQAAAGSYTRGSFFFALQSTSWYMLLKTLGKLSAARGIEERRIAFARDSLDLLIAQDTVLARELSDPVAHQEAVDANGRVVEIRALIESRERHRQDWITYTLFFTLMSGVDAYVNAHLTDFPAELSVRQRPDGSFSLGVSIPTGRR